MPKQIIGNYGQIKVYSLSGESFVYKAVASFIDKDGEFLLSSPFFGNEDSSDMTAIKLKLITNPDEEIQNSKILFPRLKPLDENYFIFSGLYTFNQTTYNVVGKFKGKIPEHYPQYEDDVKYPEDYWELK